LSITLIHLAYVIVPLPFRKTVDRAEDTSKTPLNFFLVSNVYQYNNSFAKLLALVKERNPDIYFLVEQTKWRTSIL
jgi:hypothetical protein